MGIAAYQEKTTVLRKHHHAFITSNMRPLGCDQRMADRCSTYEQMKVNTAVSRN